MYSSNRELSIDALPIGGVVSTDRPTISGLLARLQAPIPDIGYRMHEFDRVGFRGRITHEGIIVSRQGDPDRRTGEKQRSTFRSLPISSGDYLILTLLNRDELASSGDFLKLFLNEVGISPESPDVFGALILQDHHLDIGRGRLDYQVGVVRSEDRMSQGEPGLLFTFNNITSVAREDPFVSVKFDIVPEPTRVSTTEVTYRSDLHRLACVARDMAVEPSGMAFVNQAAIQAAELIEKAILAREIRRDLVKG